MRSHIIPRHSIRSLAAVLLICMIAPAAVASGEDNPLSANNKAVYRGLKAILLRSAEIVPEEHYAFKPTEAVRSFGQIVGHIADSQYVFCSIVLSEKNPAPKVEKTQTSKATLIAALRDSFAYCDKAYDGMTDASAPQMLKFHGTDMPKLGVLMVNNVHTTEHYGNLITYMRMKNIVPPTSDPAFMQQPQK